MSLKDISFIMLVLIKLQEEHFIFIKILCMISVIFG